MHPLYMLSQTNNDSPLSAGTHTAHFQYEGKLHDAMSLLTVDSLKEFLDDVQDILSRRNLINVFTLHMKFRLISSCPQRFQTNLLENASEKGREVQSLRRGSCLPQTSPPSLLGKVEEIDVDAIGLIPVCKNGSMSRLPINDRERHYKRRRSSLRIRI